MEVQNSQLILTKKQEYLSAVVHATRGYFAYLDSNHKVTGKVQNLGSFIDTLE